MAYAKKSGSRHVIGFGLVILLHALIFWGLKNGLASSLIDVIRGPMETSLIEEIAPQAEAPPPPPPDFEALPPPEMIPLDISVASAPSTSSSAISTKNKNQYKAPPKETTPPRSNPRRPVSQPPYPPTSKRLGEEGTVVMLLTVDENGRVVDAKIDKSSGHARLDEAAIKEALRRWRLIPGTVDGKPVQMQYKFAVTFRITD